MRVLRVVDVLSLLFDGVAMSESFATGAGAAVATSSSLATSATLGCAGPRFWGLVPCAGTGQRAIGVHAPDPHLPKQYQPVAGQPLVLHTLAAFAAVPRVRCTLLAVAADDGFVHHSLPSSATWLARPCGGPTRAATVMGGLQALLALGAHPQDWVLVHDAARCLVTPQQINELIDACQHDPVGGLLAHKLPDTLKVVKPAHDGLLRAAATLDRSDKWLAQTPQMFRLAPLLQALEQYPAATDEASAMEAAGHAPRLVPGGAQNFKVTYPEDFALAEAIVLARSGATVAPGACR